MNSPVPTAERLRVVVVDDTPDLRDLLRLAMERTGEFRVVAEAGNGREGVAAARAHQPDVVLLDIAMPVMDGLEALPLVRQASPASTVVMLSGFGASEMTGKALEGGADGYIQKGQALGATLAQVRTLVTRSSARRGGPGGPATPSGPAPTTDPLEVAPFGFLHVRDERIVRANREACRLLGDLTAPGERLETVAPPLAEHLSDHGDGPFLPDGPVTLDLGVPPRRTTTTVRRHGEDLLAFLHPESGDEVELLRRAIATAAHEIRNPVGVLVGVAETLSLHGEDLSATERARMLEALGRQARLLDDITADLLTAGQAQHGTLTLGLEAIDPAALVRPLLDADVSLRIEGDDVPHVLTDPMRFQQMLGNLLSNARKYGEPPLTVCLAPDGEHVRVDVEDHGPGVPEDFRARLFQEYARAPGTGARGTGLGLFVVRALAEAQGGTATYRPREPRGSVFSLRLPAAP